MALAVPLRGQRRESAVAQFSVVRHHRAARLDFTFWLAGDAAEVIG